MKYQATFLILFAAAGLATTGCDSASTPTTASTASSPGTTGVSTLTIIPPENSVAVTSATSAQCANGGIVVTEFVDVQHDGTLDAGDTILSTNTICNGASGANGTNGTNGTDGTNGVNGTNGVGAGIQVTQASLGQCIAGGVQITTFVDLNNDGQLDAGDPVTSVNTVCDGTNGANGINGNSFNISQTSATTAQCPAGGTVYAVDEFDGNGNAVVGSASASVVCNGTNGANGANGADGTNGVNGVGMVFETINASSAECPSGGDVLVMASDTLGTGLYDPTDANQQSVTICNGLTGAQGPAGPVSPFSPITPIMPCGEASSPWKEVLLCMADGNILADFSADMSGDMTRLSFIPDGEYEDTDSSGCIFSVADDGSGGFVVSWGAGSNAYSTWNASSYDCAVTSD